VSEGLSPKGIFQRFRKDVDRALIVFSLMMIMILWFGSMAVDLMRYETTRAKFQGPLDGATLAAVNLDQIMPPAEVVRDYLTKQACCTFCKVNPTCPKALIIAWSQPRRLPRCHYFLRLSTHRFEPVLDWNDSPQCERDLHR
jgi:hypothetical protein